MLKHGLYITSILFKPYTMFTVDMCKLRLRDGGVNTERVGGMKNATTYIVQ